MQLLSIVRVNNELFIVYLKCSLFLHIVSLLVGIIRGVSGDNYCIPGFIHNSKVYLPQVTLLIGFSAVTWRTLLQFYMMFYRHL